MFKKIIVGLLNKVFGLNLTIAQLDAFIEFINMLIGLFGSANEAVKYTQRTVKQVKMSSSKARARAAFDGMEKTLSEA